MRTCEKAKFDDVHFTRSNEFRVVKVEKRRLMIEETLPSNNSLISISIVN